MTMPIPGSERFSSRPVDPRRARARRCPPTLPLHTVDPGADRRARPADLRGDPAPALVGHRRDGRGAQAHVRLADRHRRQRLRLRDLRRARPGGPGRPLQHDARRRGRPGHLLDAAAPRRQPRHRRGRHVPVQRPVGRRRAAPERRRSSSSRSSTRASCSPGPAPSRTSPTSAASASGSFTPRRQDVFSEALPTPPIKVVRGLPAAATTSPTSGCAARGCRMLVGLDLRAKIGANSVGRQRLLARDRAVRRRHGQGRDEADDGRRRAPPARQAARACPTAPGRPPATRTSRTTGDRGLHKITVAMTKDDDHLTFDFTGTDPQAGVINCTYAGHARRRHARAAADAGRRHPVGGGRADALLRPRSPRRARINNATFPAAVSRGPIGPAWLTGNLVAECLSQMLDRSVELGTQRAGRRAAAPGTPP